MCWCRDIAAANPLPLPSDRKMLEDLASIGVPGAHSVEVPRLVRLSSAWRELAELCDSEIERTKTTPPTIIMSDDERVRYEQAARTYRFCADALDSETNVKDAVNCER